MKEKGRCRWRKDGRMKMEGERKRWGERVTREWGGE